jgi:Alcohol dehydrogenase GroES-like domain
VYAVQFDRFGPPEVLTLGTAPAPHPGPGEVRIAVKAAGVSPVDLALRAGLSPASQRISLPHIPGVNAAGVIDEIGAIPVTYGPGLPGRVRALGLGRVEFALHIAGADALPELIASPRRLPGCLRSRTSPAQSEGSGSRSAS